MSHSNEPTGNLQDMQQWEEMENVVCAACSHAVSFHTPTHGCWAPGCPCGQWHATLVSDSPGISSSAPVSWGPADKRRVFDLLMEFIDDLGMEDGINEVPEYVFERFEDLRTHLFCAEGHTPKEEYSGRPRDRFYLYCGTLTPYAEVRHE